MPATRSSALPLHQRAVFNRKPIDINGNMREYGAFEGPDMFSMAASIYTHPGPFALATVAADNHPELPPYTAPLSSKSPSPLSYSDSPSPSLSSVSGHHFEPLATPQSSKKKKSHARKTPPGHIPRPRNAFIIFRCDFVGNKHVPPEVENDHRVISRIAGKVWLKMPKSEKEKWEAIALKEAEEHRKKYPSYRYTPLPKPDGVEPHHTNAFKKAPASKKSGAIKPAVFNDSDAHRCNELASLLVKGYRGDQLANAVQSNEQKLPLTSYSAVTTPDFSRPMFHSSFFPAVNGFHADSKPILQPRPLYYSSSVNFAPSILRAPYISRRLTSVNQTPSAPSKHEETEDQWENSRSSVMLVPNYDSSFPAQAPPLCNSSDDSVVYGGLTQSNAYSEIPRGPQSVPETQLYIPWENYNHCMAVPYAMENESYAAPLQDATDELTGFFTSHA